MKNSVYFLLFIFLTQSLSAQKDSLQLGDRYSDDQLYASISYVQFFNQPSVVSRSAFSYGISVGFIKDFTLNTSGSISFAAGVGYGFDLFNHELKVEDINGSTNFNTSENLSSNIFRSHNLEFPIEFRWRTSNAIKYDFWRIYGGVKFIYNLSNEFEFIENAATFSYKNVNAYNNFQYGLTLSAGYDEFNINVFYGLTSVFNNAIINGEPIDTSILKFGLIFYIL